jgi:hypothetical protein
VRPARDDRVEVENPDDAADPDDRDDAGDAEDADGLEDAGDPGDAGDDVPDTSVPVADPGDGPASPHVLQ